MRTREPEKIALKIIGAFWLAEGAWEIVMGVQVPFSDFWTSPGMDWRIEMVKWIMRGVILGGLGYVFAFRTSLITKRMTPITELKQWKCRLPAMAGIFFLLLSLPFIFGVSPSIHGGSIYAILYLLIDILPILIFSERLDKISNNMFGFPSLEQANIVAIIGSLIFWLVVAFIIGTVVDIIKLRNKPNNGI